MNLKDWARDTALRAVKTAAQTAVALLGTDVSGLINADWVTILLTAALAGVVSILHNVSTLQVGDSQESPYADVVENGSGAGAEAARPVESSN